LSNFSLAIRRPSPRARRRRPRRPLLAASARRVDVRGQVLGEVVGAGEALAAHVAVVRPLAGVDAEVARQVALAPEGPAAEEADERPLPRVLPHVQLQVLLGADALAAEGAGEAALALLLGGVGAQEPDDGGVVAAAEDVQARSRGHRKRERHRVDRVVLVGLGLLGVGGGALACNKPETGREMIDGASVHSSRAHPHLATT
jgi:hypothetical protein